MRLKSRRGIAALLMSAGILGAMIAATHADPLPDPLPCVPCFIGALKLAANPADGSGRTKLLMDDIYFVDPQKFVWKAGKGDVTDGASIPDLFQPIIGGPFEAGYLPAAVIHDHYTDKAHRVRSWQATARVFYQAMVVNGVNIIRAKTMYFAVYAFGPHWDVIAKGVPCGKNCVFSAPLVLEIESDGDIKTADIARALPDDMQFVEEPADYRQSHATELADVQARIEASEIQGEPLSLEEIERMAALNHPDSIFLMPPR
jgi:hypothetical protein